MYISSTTGRSPLMAAPTAVPQIAVLSRAQILYYFWSIVAVAPLGIATIGVAIWWRRKRL